MEEHKYSPISDRSAWCASDHQASQCWLTVMTEDNIQDMEFALASLGDRDPFDETVTCEDFALPSLERKLQAIARDIEFGRGFCLIRGLPVARWGIEKAVAIYWGLSLHLGTPVSQSAGGERLVAVQDAGKSADDLNVRGPLTNSRLYFHSDFADIAGLLCMHPAKSGGVSRICSSMAIYNALLTAGKQDLLDAFYEGFPFDRKGEQPSGMSPIAETPIPMLSWHGGRLSFRYVPGWSETATKRTGIPWTARQRAAIEAVNQLANLPEFFFDMNFQAGDVQYLNNYSVLHSRTDFIDHEEPERKRVLQRVWLRARLGRDLAPSFDHLFGEASTRDGIPPTRNRAAA